MKDTAQRRPGRYPSAASLPDSPVAEQLRRGFRKLHFRPELESQYREETYERHRRQLRINLLVALLLVVAFTQLDRLILPEASAPVMNVIRYGVLLPSLAIALLLTFLPVGARVFRPVVGVVAPIALAGIVALVLIAWMHGEPRVFNALIFAAIYIYFLIGLSFRGVLVTNLTALVAYAYGTTLVGMPFVDAAYYTIVLFFSLLIATVIAYNLEHALRRSWLESRLLGELVERDGLTGIFNRRRFDEHLERAWQQATRDRRPLALLFADLDCFKAYNDRYGHQAGDEALRSVATVLAGAARRPLDIACRYGGEEFAVLLYDTTAAHARELADQVLAGVRALQIPHGASTAAQVMTISIGVACVRPALHRSPAGLVQLADQALYMAKDAGRNRMQLLEGEYEQMQTGYFRREELAGTPGDGDQ